MLAFRSGDKLYKQARLLYKEQKDKLFSISAEYTLNPPSTCCRLWSERDFFNTAVCIDITNLTI